MKMAWFMAAMVLLLPSTGFSGCILKISAYNKIEQPFNLPELCDLVHLTSISFKARSLGDRTRRVAITCRQTVGGSYRVRFATSKRGTTRTQGMAESFYTSLANVNLQLITSEFSSISLSCHPAYPEANEVE